MRTFDKNALLEEELNDLRFRLELVAHLETTQWNIKQNQDEINKLKAENKLLDEEISAIKAKSAKTRSATSAIEKLQQRLLDMQKKHDELMAQLRSKEDKLNEMQKEIVLLKKEEEAVVTGVLIADDAKDLQSLENKLDKVAIKTNEVITIKKTYETIIKLLQQERMMFDQQLETYEKAIKMKRQDVLEMEMMARDADRTKELARTELTRFEYKIQEERRRREREINRLKELIRTKSTGDDAIEKKVAKPVDETPALVSPDKKEKSEEEVMIRVEEFKSKCRKLKEVTGAAEVSEIFDKVKDRSEKNVQLKQLKESYTIKLREVREKSRDIAQRKVSVKSSDEKELHDELLLQELQERVNKALAEQQQAQKDYEKVMQLNRTIGEALHHLHERLEGVNLEEESMAEVETMSLSQVAGVCLKKVKKLTEVTRAKESADGEIPIPPTAVTKAVLPKHNVRANTVIIPTDENVQRVTEYAENEVVDRETMKKYAAQMMNAKLKTKQGKKKRG